MIIGWVVTNIVGDVKKVNDEVSRLNDKINSCQSNLPMLYVLKDDYKEDIAEIKHMISEMYGIIRKNGIK